jgi:glutamate-1-semialdehyde 2,1-aminomutase
MARVRIPAEEDVYVERTPTSRLLHQQAREVMPGGTTRTSVFFEPYPLYIERGAGCRVWDADGVERLDFIGNYSALILGHAHPAVVAAIAGQAALGTAFAAANRHEVELAAELCRRVASLESVRLCSSGTEATMFALRLARAFTGRPRIARFEGGYHGSHDYALVGGGAPEAAADSSGLPPRVADEVVVLPYNATAEMERTLAAVGDEVAAVIVEPMLGSGGCIPADPDFLAALRELTRRRGIVLVFDEIISFRLAPGGAQERYGIAPDLTTLGKVIGGGLPVAAFGGRADIMAQMDPRGGGVPQAGTYNGHPLGMAAGLAALRELTPDVYDRLNRRGDELRSRLADVFAERAVPARVTGSGSLLAVHFTGVPVRDARAARAIDDSRRHDFFLGMLNEGILLAPRGMAALSTPMGDGEIETFLAAAARVADRMAARATD